jgi:hypothetical protein
LDEDDSVIHTNVNSPRMSKPASPSSQLHSQVEPQVNHRSESESGLRVSYSQSSSSGNQVVNFGRSQKASVEIHDGLETEVEQPLLNNTLNS